MAVLGRLLVSSAERLDLPDLLSLDSYAAGDWKYFLKGLVGDTKPFILKGFDVIDPGNAIGTQSCSVRVADSITFYPGSNSGSFFHGLQEGHPQAAPLVPELRKNAVNYVYLTFSTFNTSVDTRAFWDPDKDGGVGGEFTQDINTESVLKVDINVSTGSFPANTVPVAKITVGPVVITAIEDARDMMFRLGSGGINPNPFNSYGWRALPSAGYERQEPPTQMLAGGVNPFQGADKNILTLKEWMDAVMSKLRELGGTTYWYDDTSSFSIITNFYDAVATAFKSKGKWIHDTVTPGLLTWTEDIQIKMTSDPRTYIIRQGSVQLQNEQVMYIGMQRNLPFNATDESVQWTNGQLYVNTIGGAVGLFANLSKGDYIKKANDTIDKWVRVEEFYDAVNLGGSTTTAAGARSVRIGSAYLGTTGAEKGRYDKGVYLPGEVTVSDRDVAAIGLTGGNFHWLALRSDTIENVSNIVTTDLAVDIDQHDGATARVTSVAHGLVDGDRVTIAGTTNFDGTYQVEVESVDIFYINVSGGPFADESGTGHYATVTTSARMTPYGFQEESANHGFNTNDTIQIDATTNYDGSYQVSVRSATTFTIPVPGPAATETAGTATLAKIIVRTEGAVAQLIQGQIVDIGGGVADNIRLYLGMDSLSQTAPNYAIPPDYNTLDGMQNYNGVVNENITARVSKLTAMIADKAQDKTVKALPSSGITSINNTQNGAAQEITFTPAGGSLTFITPGSDGQYILPLPDSAPGISLLVNQAAYVEIDRNNPTNVGTFTVADIVDVPISENIFLVAVRLLGTDIYLWEGSIIESGGAPGPGFDVTIVKQNAMLKLVEGGTWSWDLANETLAWDAAAFVQLPGLANSVNEIPSGSIVLAAGEVAYVSINRVGPGGTLTVTAAANASLVTTTDMIIIARRENSDVIVGAHSMRLVDGESKLLYAGASNETLSALGLASEADEGALRILQTKDGVSKRVVITPIDTVVFDNTTWGNEISGLRMSFDGIQLDLQTGNYYGYGDGTLGGSGPLIGSAFTPVAFTSPNLFRWYSINFVADTLNADGTMSVAPLILSGTDGASSGTAVKAPFSSKKVGQVLVQAPGSGLTINNIGQANVVQLASGAGGGGSGGSPKMIGGGVFAWDLDTTSLTFESDIFVEQARLNYADNTIDQASVSPIVLPTVNHVAYIDRLNASSGGADLTVTVDLITNVKDGQIIIARRDGDDVIVGSTSNRIRPNDKLKLFSNHSYFENQDKFAKLMEGGVWSWDAGAGELSFSAQAFIDVPGVSQDTNIINPSESPITLADGEVAHVEINRKTESTTPVITQTGTYSDPSIGSLGNIAVSGPNNVMYVSDGARLLSVNTSNKALPVVANTYTFLGGLSSTAGQRQTVLDDVNNVLYTLTTAAGLTSVTAFDVSSPYAPVLLSTSPSFSPPGFSTLGLVLSPNKDKLFFSSSNTVYGINVTNPAALPAVNSISSGFGGISYGTGALGDNNTLYSINGTGSVRVIDVTSVAAMSTLATVPVAGMSTPIDMVANGSTLYINDVGGTIYILDISTPALPVFTTGVVGALTLPQSLRLDPRGLLYQGVFGAGTNFAVYDISNPIAPAALTTVAIPNARPSMFYSDGAYLYSADAGFDTIEFYEFATGTSLVVTVSTVEALETVMTDDTFVIARRSGSSVFIGAHSMRLEDGQSSELDAQESIQTRNNWRSVDFLRSDNPVTWTGTDLSFTTDIILETINTRIGQTKLFNIDAGTSPITLADGEIAYVAIDRAGPAGPVSVVVSSTVPTVAQENIEYVILFKRIDANGAGYLHIPLHKQVLEPGQTVRLGASGSGSGGANAIVETVKNHLLDSVFDLATPIVFSLNADSNVDPASTGEYSLVTKTFDMDTIGETMVSTQLLDANEFLNNDNFLSETELLAFWTQGSIDPIATYEVSRNGGNEWQTIDMERVGNTELFRGIHTFEDEAINQVLSSQSLASSDGDNDLDGGAARQRISTGFLPTVKLLVKQVSLRLTKTGSPAGFYTVSIYNDNAGSPGTSILSQSAALPLSGVAPGTNNVTIDIPDVTLVGNSVYHIVVESDAAYRASYVNGVTELSLRSLAAGSPVSRAYNGTIWSALTSRSVYEVLGIALDLRVRITSGTSAVKLDAFAAYYERAAGETTSGVKEIEVFSVNGSLNTTDFAVSNFVVNPEMLRVYDVSTGQVYRYGAFSVNGNTVQFTSGQFSNPGVTFNLIFDQTMGGTFDNSDQNALLMATNHLGSTDASVDRSIAGRGIFLRRPDGTLREIAIDDSDNIVVYSV